VMSNNFIPNDDLGEWGESKFRTLCAAAGVVANKVERDKKGWDFIVQLPVDRSTASLPLDQRPNGLRCLIQIKTRWRRDDDRLEMTLSAAELLAKDPGPAFVLVLTAERGVGDDDPTLAYCHLIHMLDGNLERVLRRLRDSAAAPLAKTLGEQKISYSPSTAGMQLPPQGKAVHDALIRICGPDAQAYIAAKGEQLKQLGYSSGRYQLKATINAKNIDEFVEMMLGLRPAPVENLETYDARFGVLMPVDRIKAEATAQLSFKPHATGKCTIRVRGQELTAPAVFRGEVFVPFHPGIPIAHKRILIRAPFFSLDLRGSGVVNFDLECESLLNAALSLEDWRHVLRLLEILGESKVNFDVEGDGDLPRHTVPLRAEHPLQQEPWIAALAQTVVRGEALLNRVGARGAPTSLDVLREAANMINRAYVCLFEPGTAPLQSFQSPCEIALAASLPDVDTLYVDCAVVAGVALAYACRVTLRLEHFGVGLLWRPVNTKPEKLAIIDKTTAAFRAFAASAKKYTGLESTLIRNVNEGLEAFEADSE
jgi:hypothetical protein